LTSIKSGIKTRIDTGESAVGRIATTGAYRLHPNPRYTGKIRLVQGRRKTHPEHWEVQFKTGEGGWSRPPIWLGTTDWDEARDAAAEKFAIANTGQPVTKQRTHERSDVDTFGDVAVVTLARLGLDAAAIREHEGERKARRVTNKIARIRNILLPQFGHVAVAKLNPDTNLHAWLQDLRISVKGKPGLTKRPAQSTIGNLQHAWQEVMQDAVKLGYTTRSAAPKLSKKGFKKGAREPAFSAAEMRRIRDHMTDDWIADGHTATVRANRRLLRVYVALAATTGLTPGLEIERTTHAKIEEVTDSNGQRSLTVAVQPHQGKRPKGRRAWVYTGDVWDTEKLVRDLLQWRKVEETDKAREANPEKYIFHRPRDGKRPNYNVTFRAMLGELGLVIDPLTGIARKPYSLRHYYATEALSRGTNVAALAGVMGTSLRMIEDHYNHVLSEMMSGQFTGSIGKKVEPSNDLKKIRSGLIKQMPEPHPDALEDDPEELIPLDENPKYRAVSVISRKA
jgi:integrase